MPGNIVIPITKVVVTYMRGGKLVLVTLVSLIEGMEFSTLIATETLDKRLSALSLHLHGQVPIEERNKE